jgi:hypothetical protein
VETGDAEWPYATAVLDGTIPLGDAEGDVIVELGQGCVGPRFETNGCANRTALVLDDLRLE